MSYKIEKGIKPPLVKNILEKEVEEMFLVLKQMKTNDSIVLEGEALNKIFPIAKKKTGFSFYSKRVTGERFDKRRIWRIK